MADKHFEVELPEEVLAGFGWHETEVPHKIREAFSGSKARVIVLQSLYGVRRAVLKRRIPALYVPLCPMADGSESVAPGPPASV